MRYLAQFVVPIIILFGVIFVVARKRSRSQTQTADRDNFFTAPTLLLILVVGSALAVGLLFGIQGIE